MECVVSLVGVTSCYIFTSWCYLWYCIPIERSGLFPLHNKKPSLDIGNSSLDIDTSLLYILVWQRVVDPARD